MPELDEVAAEYEGRVTFLALSIEPDARLVADAAREFGLRHFLVARTESEVLAPFGVREVPSVAFVDARGVIVAAASGPQSAAFVRRRVEALLRAEAERR